MRITTHALIGYSLLSLLVISTGFWAQAQQTPDKPNIIIIVADDLGYHDLGCQGATDLKTPHLDQLAAGGVRCTSGYVTAPQCSPSRCGLLTGRYQQRFGFENNGSPELERDLPTFGLPLTERTIADYLRAAGYHTGLVGKWHLGTRPDYRPLQRGFDYFLGFLGGGSTYLPRKDQFPALLEGDNPAPQTGDYLTDIFSDGAVQFIRQTTGKPFFLLLTYNAPHAPLEVTDAYRSRFPGIKDPKRQTFAGMMAALDDGVGKIMNILKDRGIDKNTLVVFVSDNGGPTRQNSSLNTPLGSFKGDLQEGGIRVPFIWHWPGVLPGGRVYNESVSTLDLLPTALAVAGKSLPKTAAPFDGVNLLPFLTGEQKGSPHSALFWRFGPLLAVRSGPYKLVRLANENQFTEVHDLRTNIGEVFANQLTNERIRKRLTAQLNAWNQTLMVPMWGNFPIHHVSYQLKRFGVDDSPMAALKLYQSFFGKEFAGEVVPSRSIR